MRAFVGIQKPSYKAIADQRNKVGYPKLIGYRRYLDFLERSK